jgi:hypothetical protein
MSTRGPRLWFYTMAFLLLAAPLRAEPPAETPAQRLKDIAKQFAPVDLKVDLSSLPINERRALAKIVRAARLMDALFLRQAWSGNAPLLLDLVRDSSPLGKAFLHAFLLNGGPWDRLASNAPFIPGVPPKPPQSDFYPLDATKAEVERWIKSLPPSERAQAEGFYTVVRRTPGHALTTVPYSVEYQNLLATAAQLLDEASRLTTQPTLGTFLHARAQSFSSNNYYDSDVAWMELDANIEPTIGPYETYEDGWFSYKAAFEAFVGIRDDAESKKLQKFSAELQEIEDHLPEAPEARNKKLGALAPIVVVNEIFCAGDANHGVQTAAYNLPNDERIAKEKGTKRVMLKNVQEAKFKAMLVPIAKLALSPADQKDVAFEPFFTHILMHELMHGLGPHTITVGGRATTPRQELQEAGSAIEEAKADVSGLFALQYLIDKGVIDKSLERTLYPTYLAGMFRSVRFGISEAHGRSTALQLNRFLELGAIAAKNGVFSVDVPKFKQAVVQVTRELLTLEANGDAAGARALLERTGKLPDDVKRVLAKLAKLPVDIEPRFVSAEQLMLQNP